MSNIGFSSPDWGMAGYYAQEDAYQKWEEYREEQFENERRNYESQKEEVLNFAQFVADAYRESADGEDYETESWREWLANDSALVDDDLNKAVLFAIREEEPFTFAEAIDDLAFGRFKIS